MSSYRHQVLFSLIVLCGGSVYYVGPTTQLPLHVLTLAFAVFVTLLERHITSRALHGTLISCILVAAILTIYYLKPPAGQSFTQYIYFFGKYTAAALAILCCSGRPKNYFCERIFKVLTVFMVHALLNAALSLVAPSLFSMELVHAAGTFTAANIFYMNKDVFGTFALFGFDIPRNQGIFWEPGVLQAYMNVLLFLALFVCRSPRIVWLSLLTVVTTWSTIGMTIAALLLALYAARQGRRNVVGTGIFLCALLAGTLVLLAPNISDKLAGDRVSSSSLRMTDALAALQVISDHPFGGVGVDFNIVTRLTGSQAISEMFTSDYLDNRVSNTNSLLGVAVSFGIPMSALFLWAFYKNGLVPSLAATFSTMMLAFCVTEPLAFTVFFLMFVASSLIKFFGKFSLRQRT